MSSLRQILQREIAEKGAIPFGRFMEQALYCPEYGYYQRSDAQIGRAGDFYTSVSVGSLFGELLAFQFAEWLERSGGNPCLVEAGAHDGRLARDILNWFRERRPAVYSRPEYCIVEPAAAQAQRQRKTLEEFAERLRW